MDRKRVIIEPLGHKIEDVSPLSVIYLFSAYGRFALRHGLHRIDLELLVLIDSLCGVNVERLGSGVTCMKEVYFSYGKEQSLVRRSVSKLERLGYVLRSADSGTFPVPKGFKPASLSITRSAKQLLQLLPLEIEEQQKRINNYHLNIYKTK